MSYHVRKDGYWFVKYYQQGKEKRKYTGKGQEGEDRAFVLDQQLNPKNGKAIEMPSSLTFNQLADRFIKLHDIKPKTRQCYEDALKKYIRPVFGAVPLTA
jgi:hypothetical protein